jgi:sterol 3beta-glucosyltransferase
MSKILITTFGTRGDIQPFIALGKGLKTAGYEVGLCTSEGFKGFVEEHGLQYVFMDNELLRLSQAVLGEANGAGSTLNTLSQMMPAMRRSMVDEWNAARTFQPDLIIYHPKCFGSIHIAEKLDIPAIMSLPLPFYTPTRAFPVPFLANLPFGTWFNRFSYLLIALPNMMYSGMVNKYRQKTLGLPPLGRFANWLVRSDGTPVPVLYPYSPYVLPVPDDFPPQVHVTGYWFLDRPDGWTPDPELVRFLEVGTPPVYIGFGSMGGRKGEERVRIVHEALQKSGQRAVLVSGWGGLKAGDLPASVFLADSVPHDWLFPRVAAVVHHGGAGTTAAGLRAGKPSIICPFMADQPFWGKLVHQLGVGPEPVPQSQLNAERLAAAIEQATHDPSMQQRAADLGERIRAEDGVARAVEIIGAAVKTPMHTEQKETVK